MDQGKRIKTLDAFKAGQLQVLVATDVAGRGIHIDDVSHVINFTLPEEPEDYVHRIGRTGRAGNKGISISFACEDDAFRLPAIETLLGRPIVCEQPPADLLAQEPPSTVGVEKRRPTAAKARAGRATAAPARAAPVTGAPAAAKGAILIYTCQRNLPWQVGMKTILVVEDSPMVMKIIKHVMGQNPHYQAVFAERFAQAQDCITQIGSDLFAAVVDLNLPDAPDGEIVDYCLSRKIPTVVLTGSFDATRREKLLAKGVVDYVTKEGRFSYVYVSNLLVRLIKTPR